jgi:hypothetical protein
MDAFIFFPWSLFGLAALDLGVITIKCNKNIEREREKFAHEHIHCYKDYYKHSKIAMTIHMNLTQ